MLLNTRRLLVFLFVTESHDLRVYLVGTGILSLLIAIHQGFNLFSSVRYGLDLMISEDIIASISRPSISVGDFMMDCHFYS